MIGILGGCLPSNLFPRLEEDTVLVPPGPLGGPAHKVRLPRRVHSAPTDDKLALRVHTVGQQLLTANPHIGMKPLFATYGSDLPEVFHTSHPLSSLSKDPLQSAPTDGRVIYISEGMVRRCKTDEELAALLARELAKMVVEREALASEKMRTADERPPIDVPIGNGIQNRDASEFRLAELAKYEKQRSQQIHPPLPDPEKLARSYLRRAGYSANAYDAVTPLLDEAEQNYLFEQQFKQRTSRSPWTVVPNGR